MDAIRSDAELEYNQVATTIFDKDGAVGTMDFRSNGRYLSTNINPLDLVAEYVEPKLQITEKDVGKRVRLRNGSIALITFWDASPNCDSNPPVYIAIGWTHMDGTCDRSGDHSPEDVVEILD